MTSPKEIAFAAVVGLLILAGLIWVIWQKAAWNREDKRELSKSWSPDAEAERQWKMRSRNER